MSHAEINLFRHQARTSHHALLANLDGISHEQSLMQPEPGGNCLNWVLGHLLTVHAAAVELLGQDRVVDPADIELYARGQPPLTDPAAAKPFEELLSAWSTAAERVDAGLAELDPSRLDDPAPFSPGDDADETVRSLLATICFHQAYHVGQTALLRRLIGKPGAIA